MAHTEKADFGGLVVFDDQKCSDHMNMLMCILRDEKLYDGWRRLSEIKKEADPIGKLALCKWEEVTFINRELLEKSYYWNALEFDFENFTFIFKHTGRKKRDFKRGMIRRTSTLNELGSANTRGHRHLYIRCGGSTWDLFKLQVYFPCDRQGPLDWDDEERDRKEEDDDFKNLKWEKLGSRFNINMFVFSDARVTPYSSMKHHFMLDFPFDEKFHVIWSYYQDQEFVRKKYMTEHEEANKFFKEVFGREIPEQITFKTDRLRSFHYEFCGIFMKKEYLNIIVDYNDGRATGYFDEEGSEKYISDKNKKGVRMCYRERVCLNFHVFLPKKWKNAEYEVELERIGRKCGGHSISAKESHQRQRKRYAEEEELELFGEYGNLYSDPAALRSPLDDPFLQREMNRFVVSSTSSDPLTPLSVFSSSSSTASSTSLTPGTPKKQKKKKKKSKEIRSRLHFPGQKFLSTPDIEVRVNSNALGKLKKQSKRSNSLRQRKGSGGRKKGGKRKGRRSHDDDYGY